MKVRFLLPLLLLVGAPAFADCAAEFQPLLSRIASDDKALAANTLSDYFVEEVILKSTGEVTEKRKLETVPSNYRYEGRVFPSTEQQRRFGLSLHVRPVVLKDLRVVSERVADGSEPSSYWFWRKDGCWKLSSRAVNVR